MKWFGHPGIPVRQSREKPLLSAVVQEYRHDTSFMYNLIQYRFPYISNSCEAPLWLIQFMSFLTCAFSLPFFISVAFLSRLWLLISSTSKSISLSVCNCPHHNSIRHHLGVNWGRHCMYARLLLCFHYFPAEFHEQSQRRWKLFFFFLMKIFLFTLQRRQSKKISCIWIR